MGKPVLLAVVQAGAKDELVVVGSHGLDYGSRGGFELFELVLEAFVDFGFGVLCVVVLVDG